ISSFQSREHIRQFAVTCRTTDQPHPRRALENLFAFLLRHAAQHSDDLAFALFLPVFTQTRENFLRRLFANAASVVKDQGSGFRRLYLLIPARQQEASDLFRIVVIHLAAECLKEERSPLPRGYTTSYSLGGQSF